MQLNKTLSANLEERVIQEAAVVFCTVSTCGSFMMRKASQGFEIGIIDEAGQCIEVSS
jgi:superfamily I DNA and/or RNA helicase